MRENLYGESVQFCITGGGLVRPETLRFFNGIGYWLSNGYGMTETGITSVELSNSMETRSSGSIGLPLSSVMYKVQDGILHVKGTSTARRIRTDGVWKERGGEWFHTGDLAEERDGRVHLLGRSDDLVIGAPKKIVEKGFIRVPDRPGLGVDDYNDEVIREHLHPDYPDMWTETSRWDDVYSHDRLWS